MCGLYRYTFQLCDFMIRYVFKHHLFIIGMLFMLGLYTKRACHQRPGITPLSLKYGSSTPTSAYTATFQGRVIPLLGFELIQILMMLSMSMCASNQNKNYCFQESFGNSFVKIKCHPLFSRQIRYVFWPITVTRLCDIFVFQGCKNDNFQ